MAQKDYTPLAQAVADAVGGRDNIVSVTNCMTRLRFVLKDDTIPDAEAIKAIDGVKGVMNQGGQYQVVVGPHVSTVRPIVEDYLGLGEAKEESAIPNIGEGSLFNRFFKIITGCIAPLIGPMIGGGIIRGLITILEAMGIIAFESGTYQVLYAASSACLYFMPIIVGFSAAKVFGCNQYVGASIGASLMYPYLIDALGAEGGLTFLGLPIANASYHNTLFPVILAVFLASLVERGSKKVIPEVLQMMLVPFVTLVVSVPAAWLAIGPLMNLLSDALSSSVNGLFAASPLFAGILLGGFWQVIVLLGLHAAMLPILINNIATMGSDPVNAVLGITVWALAGVSLGYALKMRDAKKRAEGFSNLAMCLCGITEPTIYAICLPQIKCFAGAWVGGGIAGGILASLGCRLYAMAGDGLFRIPGMINPAGLDISFYGFLACAAIATVVSAVIAYFMADPEQ